MGCVVERHRVAGHVRIFGGERGQTVDPGVVDTEFRERVGDADLG